MSEEPEFAICGHEREGRSVCVHEAGHDGQHRRYVESPGSGSYGITVYEDDGAALIHFDMAGQPGELKPLEVGAMVAYFEAVGELRRQGGV